MGRPSVAAERRRQIVDAALRCLGIHGFAGTTLDRIAEEAGMARGHMRHFAGNRDDLLVEAARRFHFGDPDRSPADASVLPEGSTTIGDALDYLFGEMAEQDAENPIALALVEAARQIEGIRPILVAAYVGTQTTLERMLAALNPDAPAATRAQTAYAVLALALGNTFMSDVEPSAERTALARATAESLLAAVATSAEAAR